MIEQHDNENMSNQTLDSTKNNDLALTQEENKYTELNSKKEEKIDKNTIAMVKLTGNLQKDIIRLMSLKPEHYQFSFTGLKRSLGNVHQQQLVNTIDRLVEDSIVFKAQDGYFLRSNMIKNAELLNSDWAESWSGKKLYPTPISVHKVYKELYGKWFGRNRFLGGVFDSKNDQAVLEWIEMTNSRKQTRLEVTPQNLKAKFENVTAFERDKAINVFSETLMAMNNPIMFEKSEDYINN